MNKPGRIKLIFTYQRCLVGTVGCFTAIKAPPLSKNHTLCSSSKICIIRRTTWSYFASYWTNRNKRGFCTGRV